MSLVIKSAAEVEKLLEETLPSVKNAHDAGGAIAAVLAATLPAIAIGVHRIADALEKER